MRVKSVFRKVKAEEKIEMIRSNKEMLDLLLKKVVHE